MKPSTVFLSYSHHDERWKDRILAHITSLTEKVSITVWDDTRIPFGSEWAETLNAELNRANVAILLLSADFLSSHFIRDVEVPLLLAREAEGNAKLLPIIVRPCVWQTVPWLAHRMVYPTNATALSGLTSVEVESQLTGIVRQILKPPSEEPSARTIHLHGRLFGEPSGAAYYDDGWAGRTREEAERLAREAAERALRAATDEEPAPAGNLTLVLETPNANRYEVTVPASINVGEFLRELLQTDLFGSQTYRSHRSTAVADLATPDGATRRLVHNLTLSDQQVQNGDTLYVSPEVRAGCFPLDTFVSVPNDRTVVLGDLRIGDSVLSPQPLAEENSIGVVEEVIRERATRLVVINDTVRITPDQGVFCVSRGGRWLAASRLRLGDLLMSGDRRIVAVRSLAMQDSDLEVGNLVLRNPADAFVANDLVVFGARRTKLGALIKSEQR